MHDPMTVAFEIRYPWVKWRRTLKSGRVLVYREPIITVWHRDPEKNGSDDSCDWFGRRRKLNKREQALLDTLGDLLHTLGNTPYYPDRRIHGTDPTGDDPAEWGPYGHAQQAMYRWLRRRWRLHPRWHVWHWRIQVHPLQKLHRWLFLRCVHCGGRFGWNEAPISYSWEGGGPCFHRRCTTEHERMTAIRRLISETQPMRAAAKEET